MSSEDSKQGMGKWLIVAFGALLLAGCGSMGINSEDSGVTGDQGAVKGKSPALVYIQLAGEYLRQGEKTAALENAKKAVVVDPKNANSSTILAVVYETLGEKTLAEKHFKQALRLDSQDSDAANAYGSFLCRLGRYDEADKYFRQALTNPLYRTPWVPVNNAGICATSDGHPEKAAAYFAEALGYNPAFTPALMNAAESSYDLGDYAEARIFLGRYLNLTPTTAASLSLAARIERKLGRFAQAGSYETQLRSTFPASREARALKNAY